ncbi:hypothetical protein CK203_027179 [Vitis vinifera]|uniref:Uncharacterized protein n=1 Tax=Vitis vinifera TaxID=29760 RepID=A0A438I624_VITVI|nr:hypothetical protein CK203_027179 [Vitis vinifera]
MGRVENIRKLANEFGYKVKVLPCTYLSLPLGALIKSFGLSLEQIQRDFLWGGRALERKPHLEMETFWRQVMSRKYREEEGGWLREAYEVGLWKAIRKVGGLLSCRVAFWWGMEAWVEEVWNHSIECKCWVPCFSRQINDWELETMEHFLLRLHGRRVSRDRDDEILWIESKNEAFSVKSLYKALYLGMQGVFPTSVIWNSWVLLRVVFLGLRGYLEEDSNFGSHSEEKVVFGK